MVVPEGRAAFVTHADAKLVERAKIECIKRKVKMTKAVDEALKLWLSAAPVELKK